MNTIIKCLQSKQKQKNKKKKKDKLRLDAFLCEANERKQASRALKGAHCNTNVNTYEKQAARWRESTVCECASWEKCQEKFTSPAAELIVFVSAAEDESCRYIRSIPGPQNKGVGIIPTMCLLY